LAALLNESGESGSKYEGEQESEGETNTNCELEIDEPDTSIKKGGKKQKKGLLACDQVSAAVAAMSDDPNPFVTVAKGRVGTQITQTPG
jgi:hypothetical protein